MVLVQKVTNLERKIQASKTSACCPGSLNSLNKLLLILPPIKTDLRTFKSRIKESTSEKEEYNYIIQPAISSLKYIQHATIVYEFVNYHISICKESGNRNQLIHAIQMSQENCSYILNKIRNLPRNPLFLIPYAGTPKALSTIIDVGVLFIPFIDLDCPLTWATMTHETVHSMIRSSPLQIKDNQELEFKCDFWSTAVMGPAYPLSYILSYAIIPSKAIYSGGEPTHPFNEDRMKLCNIVLQDFLGYDKKFINDCFKKAYDHIYEFKVDNESERDIEKLEKQFEKQIHGIIDGYSNKDIKKSILNWGFDWKRFRDHKVNGISKQLIKGKHAAGHTSRDILNGVVYAITRKPDLDIYDENILTAVTESIEESTDTPY